MKRRTLLSLISVIIIVAVICVTDGAQPKETKADVAGQIEGLLKERRDTVKQLVRVVEERYRRGAVRTDAVILARDELLSAELDLADSPAARIALQQQEWKHAKSWRNGQRLCSELP